MNVAAALREAAAQLAETSDTARLDAELLMAEALGVDRSAMLLGRMQDDVPREFADLIARRAHSEPVAYILGHQEFYGREFLVSPEVLIPRGDSETIVDAALTCDFERVLDCGTGSGALLLSVLAERPEATGVGIDASLGALAVAAVNAAKLGLGDRAHMLSRNWREDGWKDGLGQFDLILANPPYVENSADLAPSVARFEPSQALFSGDEGLDDYRILIPGLRDLLAPGGAAIIEIGFLQAEAVTQIAEKAGFMVKLHHDLAKRPRALHLVERARALGLGKPAASR
ncbi:peptide chain release factor N(5)-glutamine methyltransferase [Altererythrobacter sp. ZODW24]|uniref:peptide chain release factor N(5)-glutamine methyltransferase n=1 Tax=Altererythrobacter sp. ZODW24 TaxID=2185142 RepID=UPI000DF83A55|nr:peptide chain release factor N(5)-glutamine methyltransferase [Altererythrobacter sp. ZODW24]